jgi:hypothetical protein
LRFEPGVLENEPLYFAPLLHQVVQGEVGEEEDGVVLTELQVVMEEVVEYVLVVVVVSL